MAGEPRSSHRRGHRRELRGVSGRTRLVLSITPMIDVVFLLLVYFLLTTGFVSQERLLRTEAAPARADARDATDGREGLRLEQDPLVIRLVREGGGTRIALSAPLAQPLDAQGLEQVLRDAMLAPARPNGLFAPDHPIRIAPARDVPWDDVVASFHAVMRAGYSSVAFGGDA